MQERAPENMSDNRCNSIMCFETSKHPIKFMHLCTASPCRHLKQKERRIELTQKSSVTPSIRARVLEIRESKEREREKPGHVIELKLWREQCWASPPPDERRFVRDEDGRSIIQN